MTRYFSPQEISVRYEEYIYICKAQLEMYARAPHRELTRDQLFNPNVALIRHSWIINFFPFFFFFGLRNARSKVPFKKHRAVF